MHTSETTRPSRLPSLTGLRWFAAFAVFGFHLYRSPEVASDPALRDVLKVLFGPGSGGVPFFFILSGLVLTWSARPDDRPARFWRRRAARVVPNHVVTWLGVLAVLVILGKDDAKAGPAAVGLVLGQSWIPDNTYYFGINTPAWSLSCEIAFYAAFPLLLPLIRRVPGQRLWALAGALVAGIWLLPLISYTMSDELAYWFVWIFPVSRVLDFALGITLASLIMQGRWRGPGLLVSGGLVLAFYLTEPLFFDRWEWVAWMTVPLALLVAAAATADVEGRPSVLRKPVLIWLGEISFAFYLVHQPVIRFGAKVIVGDHASAPVAVVGALVMLAAAVGASWLLYRVVERPLERRLGRPRVTGPAGPPAASRNPRRDLAS